MKNSDFDADVLLFSEEKVLRKKKHWEIKNGKDNVWFCDTVRF